jgi:hypothetical protein
MLFTLLRRWARPKSKKSRVRSPVHPRTVRPQVERLEERTVPSAVRNLPGFTANSLPKEDDAPSPLANLGFTINFFGVQTNTVFVNNNGNITIGQPLAQFTPTALNTNNGGIPIIAPYFADVDTRGAGNVVMYGTDTLCGLPCFGVDYFNVDYFSAIAAGHVVKLSTFQVILIDRPDTGPGNFDIEFNYNTITWETGDASGGTNGLGGQSSRVGYSNGSGASGTNFELPGSGVNGAFLNGGPLALVSHDLAATTLGRYHFFVRNGQVVSTLAGQAVDITGDMRQFDPFRYVFFPGNARETRNHHHFLILQSHNDLYSGLFTFLRLHGVVQQQVGNSCLDEITTNTITTFGPPITLVFPQLPPGVTLANPTGITASGHEFLTLPLSVPAPGFRFRELLRFHNPRHVYLGTFYRPNFPIEIFAGPFDPTMF